LLLFLWEGEVIIKTELKKGLYVLVFFVFITVMIQLIINWYSILRYNRHLQNRKKNESTVKIRKLESALSDARLDLNMKE